MHFSEPAGELGGIKFKNYNGKDKNNGDPANDSWDLTHLKPKLQK